MRRTFLISSFLLSVVIFFASCNKKLDSENAIEAVISGETDRIPLLLQTFNTMTYKDIENIRIDSMKIRCADEPMTAFLYTTWTIKGTRWNTSFERVFYNDEIFIIVEVDSIRQSKEHKDYIEWQTNWNAAFIAATER